MKRATRPFPPRRVADLSKQSVSNFVKLARRLKRGVTLVLGAGVSASAGIPCWSQLLERMCSSFFEHWQFDIQSGNSSHDKPPSDMSVAFAEYELYSETARKLGKRLASEDMLLAAQQIKNCIRDIDFNYLLRHSLYDPLQSSPRSSRLLESLTRFCSCGRSHVHSIISYNYDDLIVYSLSSHNTQHQIVYEGGPKTEDDSGFSVYFVHGIMPIKGGYSSRIVLAEADYQQESASPFAWGNQIQLQQFAQRTCVFIGNSMTDPNARRLLRLARTTSDRPHFCFLVSAGGTDDGLFESLFDYDLSQLGVLPIRFPIKPTTEPNDDPFERLPELMDLLTEAAVDADAIWT